MTSMFIGIDYEGVSCVKMTKGTIDPQAEPDTNVGSFLFNSKWSADIKFTALDKTPYAAGINRYPAGSNSSTYKKGTRVPGGSQLDVVIKSSWFSDLPYALPMYDMKIKQVASGRFIEYTRTSTQGASDDFGRRPTYWRSLDATTSAWWLNNTNAFYDSLGSPGNALVFSGGAIGFGAPDLEKTAIVWRLPANNVAVEGAPLAPVSGQDVVDITTACRVAKPGYDVDTANTSQLAFDSSNRPAKVIAADDILLPVGTTDYDIGVEVPATTTLNLYLYDNGGNIVFPMAPINNGLQVHYEFVGSTLKLYNITRTCRARFIVIAFDDSAQTSGPNSIFRRTTVGGQGVIQLLKPGASNDPTLADIVLDSRWPCLQVLKEGYLPVDAVAPRTPFVSTAGVSQTVTFPTAGGVFPIVKYMTVHNHATYGLVVRPPATRLIDNYTASLDWYHDGYSTYCELTGTGTARFWTFNGNPWGERSVSNVWTFDWPEDPIIGIRYYILGVSI